MLDLGSVADLPSWHPPSEVLELAELVLSGALEVMPIAVAVPTDVGGTGGPVVLEDAEGTPVALLHQPDDAGRSRFSELRAFSHGPIRSERRSPAEVRAWLATLAPTGSDSAGQHSAGQHSAGHDSAGSVGGALAVPVTSVLSVRQVDAVLSRAAEAGRPLLWLAIVGSGRSSGLPPAAFWRAVRGLAEQASARGLDSLAIPVAVPVLGQTGPLSAADRLDNADRLGDADRLDNADRLGDADRLSDAALLAAAARGYGATEVLTPGQPDGVLHPQFRVERQLAMPPPSRRGLTIFFTGLSGSGKSTVAKALADRLDERSGRTVSLLDGDEVRRLLSAGLGFSRADRDLNIRRIGFVATEVTRHGGLAICAPIAPFAQAREQVRAAVEAVGDFILIHVSTPLEECERRDRKGLYAKARQGLIPDFTGISSPYEVPVEADLRLNTAQVEVLAAVDAIWVLLLARGYVDPI